MLISMDEPHLSSRFNSKYLKPFVWLIAFLVFFISSATLSANERVRLKLKSSHQFQFAGYYAAVHKGFYQAAGLSVEILEAGGEQRTVESVAERRIDFGIAGSELVIDHAAGYEVVALAPIFQHSAMALITLRDTNFTSLAALTNQRIMLGAETSSIDVFCAKKDLDQMIFNWLGMFQALRP
ncbi:ABC transporter substrate-binding protein [Nitrincola nitratireducens]|uniref:Thiamine pyrimidine synthase n=1 Tax=Nitrincola nitratireducens TaxID=1229521 RepID=W9VJE9_9GAMM|nr:ABC transporter substrate-binding protein [Nitrincola nitratireducens]EXJ10690.1 NMT1/THI5 like protein [Nitrincola nitratireducens]